MDSSYLSPSNAGSDACKRHFVVCSRLVLRSRDGACSTHSSVSRLFGKPLPSVESSAEDAVDGSLAPVRG